MIGPFDKNRCFAHHIIRSDGCSRIGVRTGQIGRGGNTDCFPGFRSNSRITFIFQDCIINTVYLPDNGINNSHVLICTSEVEQFLRFCIRLKIFCQHIESTHTVPVILIRIVAGMPAYNILSAVLVIKHLGCSPIISSIKSLRITTIKNHFIQRGRRPCHQIFRPPQSQRIDCYHIKSPIMALTNIWMPNVSTIDYPTFIQRLPIYTIPGSSIIQLSIISIRHVGK